ncbi:MAG: hypothetical protein CL920_15465 [Deltaproteobacteria bacterium]|nr:hypothetical protein [Deltaproteobacteria bacterium]MBU50086.1 hypothetical protein [Deltaproteobacteria bacterium]|tara:strand:- start:7951 stop:9939 length:1989 start_codon:yes stop_codon:yes gene_type:complete
MHLTTSSIGPSNQHIHWVRLLLCLFVFGSLHACTPPPVKTQPIQPHERPTGCHPFSKGTEDCLLPFPSSYYQIKSTDSPTGYRLAFPSVFPRAEKNDAQADPALFNNRSGFSPIAPILALFTKRIDPTTLPGIHSIASSIQQDSGVQLIEFDTHKRIPLLAELDQHAKDEEAQTLIIRPMVRLQPETRYVVVILKSVKALDGSALQSPQAFVDMVAGKEPTTSALAALTQQYKEAAAQWKAAGINTQDVLLGWDFVTGSDHELHDRMVGMRKIVFDKIGTEGPTYTIKTFEEYTEAQHASLWRSVVGEMKVPSFLKKEGGYIQNDEKGAPIYQQDESFHFRLHIPHCAKTSQTPLPIVIFGHGLFGSSEEMVRSEQPKMIQRMCMVQIAHNWLGFSREDLGPFGQSLADINELAKYLTRGQQAHMNALAMIKMMKGRMRQEPKLQHNGKALIDGKQIFYLGISNGAIQGGTLMALTPDIKRAVLNVGGSVWSLMMSRSSNVALINTILTSFYPSPVERQLIFSLVQMFFDPIDPITYAPYLLKKAEQFGVPNKHILLQEGLGDAQVPNISTRTLARTMGLPGLTPLVEPVYGITTAPAPLASAYVQYGPYYPPKPTDANIPAQGNKTHGSVRKYPTAQDQIIHFLRSDGEIKQFCQGPCDPD